MKKIILGLLALVIIGSAVFFACKKETDTKRKEYKESIQLNDPIQKEGELIGWEVITVANFTTEAPDCENPDGEGCAAEVTITYICAACQYPGFIPPLGARPIYEELVNLGNDESEDERRNRIIGHQEVFNQIMPPELIGGVIEGIYTISSVTYQGPNDHLYGRYLIQFNETNTNEILTILPVKAIIEYD
ncbi:MAG: hypothetical protein LBG80_06100 [Bacteroidales bacterium]|jgi:hypothetical protein|nr:hypothetical protein [Bacteroidales bacterium]